MGNYSRRRKRWICSILSIQESTSMLRYLGVPVVFGTPKRHHFSPSIDSIYAKLLDWKANSLSFAGRLILIKHVLSSIPIHNVDGPPIPASTCNQIERLMGNFLWPGNASSLKLNYVNWAIVCLPKIEGGLGIMKIADINNACFIKFGWQTTNENSLWALWFKECYFKKNTIRSHANPQYGTCIWKKTRLAFFTHHDGKWIFGNGQDINIWHDSWCGEQPISLSLSLTLIFNSWKTNAFHRSTIMVLGGTALHCILTFRIFSTKPLPTSSQILLAKTIYVGLNRRMANSP